MSLLTNFQDLANTVKLALDRKADKSEIPTIPVTDVEDSNGNSLVTSGVATIPASSSFVAQTTAPSDTSALWIDTDDESGAIPNGTNNGDVLVWNNGAWVSKPKWQMIYQPVEYIESTGTQCINTGVIPNAGTEWELKVSDVTNTSEGYFLGADVNSSNKFSFLIYSNTWYGNVGSTGSTGIPLSASDYYLCSLKNGTLSINETQVSLAGSLSTAKDLILLANANKSTGTFQKCRLYYFKLWNNGNLVRDYIPVYNIYTGEAGLFDKVESKLYGNQGTGTFTKGADV